MDVARNLASAANASRKRCRQTVSANGRRKPGRDGSRDTGGEDRQCASCHRAFGLGGGRSSPCDGRRSGSRLARSFHEDALGSISATAESRCILHASVKRDRDRGVRGSASRYRSGKKTPRAPSARPAEAMGPSCNGHLLDHAYAERSARRRGREPTRRGCSEGDGWVACSGRDAPRAPRSRRAARQTGSRSLARAKPRFADASAGGTTANGCGAPGDVGDDVSRGTATSFDS